MGRALFQKSQELLLHNFITPYLQFHEKAQLKRSSMVVHNELVDDEMHRLPEFQDFDQRSRPSSHQVINLHRAGKKPCQGQDQTAAAS